MNHAFTWYLAIKTYRFVDNFPQFKTIGVTCVLIVFCTFGMVVFLLFHFRVAFTMGEEVGVIFPGSWGT